MTAIDSALGTVDAYVRDDSHGYELGSRYWDYGTDCSGLVMIYVAALLGISPSELAARYPDWSTRTMRKYMQELGFDVLPFSRSAMRRGDVLLKEIAAQIGHTVIYKGFWRIFGAEKDWDGQDGDGSGAEVCERSYYDNDYNYILRFKEDDIVTDQDIEQIAEKVAEKVIMGTPIDGNNLYNRLLGIDNLTQANYKELHRTDDPSGRGVKMPLFEHFKWVAAAVQECLSYLKAIAAKVGADVESE